MDLLRFNRYGSPDYMDILSSSHYYVRWLLFGDLRNVGCDATGATVATYNHLVDMKTLDQSLER